MTAGRGPNRRRLDAEASWKQLGQRLEEVGWQRKRELYEPLLAALELPATAISAAPRPRLSVVVISWRLHRDTLRSFRILEEQRDHDFELIFVDNGAGPVEFSALEPFCDTVVRLCENTGAYLARNVGSLFARAPILLFLEDDGLPAPDLVARHLEAFDRFRCISVRGVYDPKTDNPLNRLALHYDIGAEPFPQYVVVEGNASYDASVFYTVGGWDDEIRFGGGGMELARRLLAIDPDLRHQIYYPAARIRHDYVRDEEHLRHKQSVQQGSFQRLQEKHPDLRIFRYVWSKMLGRTDLLVPRRGAHSSAETEVAKRQPPGVAPPLARALAEKGWALRPELAQAFVGVVSEGGAAQPETSVVVMVPPGYERRLGSCLRHLVGDRAVAEVVVVRFEPAGREHPAGAEAGWGAEPRADVEIRVQHDTPEALARNLGAVFTRAPILVFLHVDSVPGTDWLANHRRVHARHDVVAVQGPVVERGEHPAGREAGRFHLGDQPFPNFPDADGNHSFRAETFFAAGGWDETAGFGVEGFALSRRLLDIEPDLRKQVYHPAPVVHRDLAVDGEQLRRRLEDFERAKGECREAMADYSYLLSCWRFFEGEDYWLPDRRLADHEARAAKAIDEYRREPDYDRALARLQHLVTEYPEQAYTCYALRLTVVMEKPDRAEVEGRRRRAAVEAQPAPSKRSAEADLPPASLEVLRSRFRTLPWFWDEGDPVPNPEGLSVFCLQVYTKIQPG